MQILETDRLILREISADDAEFILDLLNQPSFIKYIGDRGVRTIETATDYIERRFTKSYRENGFGLYLVELQSQIQNLKSKIGICGFVKRDSLPHPDIGFAFLPEFCGSGYALESARAMMNYGRNQLKLSRVLAITTPDNEASIRLLEKIGFCFERLIRMPDGPEELKLFVSA